MNSAHAHLLLNHIPPLGCLFGILLVGWGLYRRSDVLVRAALAILVFSALITIPAYLTGEGAADVVRDAPGVSRSAIEPHEEAAELAAYALWILGAGAAVLLWRFRRAGSTPRRWAALVLAAAG